MARYDKYDPITGGFRAAIAADFADADLGKIFAVGLDTSGKVVKGAGNSGIVGVLVITAKPGKVGPTREIAVVDIMREGCITDFCPTSGTPGVDVGTAGTKYYANTTTGAVSTTGGAGAVYIGFTVEPSRLEVDVNHVPLTA